MQRSGNKRRDRGRLLVGQYAECCFEPVDGDGVLVAIHIEHIVLVVDLKDRELLIVGALR